MLKKQTNVPIPTGTRGGVRTRSSSEVAETIMSLEPGESFLVEANGEKTDVVQKRIGVMCVSMRKSKRVPFFCVTRQVIEDVEDEDGTIRERVPGVRVWRRDQEEADILTRLDEVLS